MAQRLTGKTITKKMQQDKGVLCLTHGHGYTLEPHGKPVNKRVAADLIRQWDLFCGEDEAPQARPKGDCLIPNEDGLFPGMSQTWRVA